MTLVQRLIEGDTVWWAREKSKDWIHPIGAVIRSAGIPMNRPAAVNDGAKGKKGAGRKSNKR